MTRKALLERAHVLNAASLQVSAALAVVATMEEARPEDVTASYKCGECSTVFASNEGLKPYCITCGSHHVQAEASDGLPPGTLPKKDEELSAYVCAGCGTYNVLASAHVKHLATHAHCVACGVVHNFEQTAADDQQDEEGADQQQDQGDGQQQQEATTVQQTAGGGLENFGDKKAPPIGKDGKAQDAEAEDQDQEDQGDQQQAATDDTTVTPEVPAAPASDSTALPASTPSTANLDQLPVQQQDAQVPQGLQQMQPPQQQQQVQQQDAVQQQQQPMQQQQPTQQAAPMTCSDDQDMAVETVPLSDDELLTDDGLQQDDAPTAVQLSLLASALSADPKAELELCHTGDHILALVNGLHVATLSKDAKAEFAGIFDKAPFAQSILHVAKDRGVKAALDDFGFEKTTVDVPMAAAVQALVKRGVQTHAKVLSETTAGIRDDLKQSLSIAATALNKGFWKSKPNPLKTALAQTLTNLGIANPNRVIANVFAASGDAYIKTLLEAALELAAKPLEFRNELSASLTDMNVRSEATASTDPDEDDEDEDTGDHQMRSATSFEVPARAVTSAKEAVIAGTRGQPSVPSIAALRASVPGPLFTSRSRN